MSPKTRKDAACEALQAFASHDRARVEACLTADAECLTPPGNAIAVALGYTSHMVGREQIVRFFVDELPSLFSGDARYEIDSVLAEANMVVIEGRLHAKLAAGREYSNEYCVIFQFASRGRIARIREYSDTWRGHHCLFG